MKQDVSLCVDSNIIQHVDAVRDLGVTFDSELTMQRNINTVTRACFHHIRRLKQICRLLGKDVAAGLVSAFILSRLDYCNAVLTGKGKKEADLYSAYRQCITRPLSAQMWITQSYLQIHHICLSFVYAFARGRTAANSFTHLLTDILLIPRPTEGRRLSWPDWLTHSGRLTHEVVTRQS